LIEDFLDLSDKDLSDLRDFAIWFDGRLRDGKILDSSKLLLNNLDDMSITTMLMGSYNIFMFDVPAIKKIYLYLRNAIKNKLYKEGSNHIFLHGWLNVSKRPSVTKDVFESQINNNMLQEFIDNRPKNIYHGYVSVFANGSKTFFRFNNQQDHVITNVDGKIIITDMGHPHAIDYWDSSSQRITIGFDIIQKDSYFEKGEYAKLNYQGNLLPIF
jgi:hypothetical protein